MKNLPPLTKIIDEGPESGFEFERLMKKLLINDGSLKGYEFEPGAEHRDKGIDGIVKKNFPGAENPVVFQFKWLEGPINKGSVAQQIKKSFESLLDSGIKFKSYILVTPMDLISSEKEWLENLSLEYNVKSDIYHYGKTKIEVLLDEYPALKKYYYGDHFKGLTKNFNLIYKRYRDAIVEEVKHLHFIGLPTGSYQKQNLLVKPELEKVYIPLVFTKTKGDPDTIKLEQIIKDSHRVVILGDPGTGKSTLAKYLTLLNTKETNQDVGFQILGKIAFFIPIREYVRLRHKRSDAFNFIDYLKYIADSNYSFNDIDADFFIAMLELGNAIVLFDGLDEITSESGRTRISKNIMQFSNRYSDSSIWITSRIVGYTTNVKLDSKIFDHYYIASLSPEHIKKFIEKWYEIQIPNNIGSREDRIQSLQSAIRENPGVRRLKTNPLLLTMMTLVHQFEGNLPDDRAKLYEKCIELLLKTWQEQKYSTLGLKNPLEERGVKYGDQLRLLAATAYHIQNMNQNYKDEDARGLIDELELERVLFKTRFDSRRMSEDDAKQDIKTFIDYIRDRAGLFVEAGINERKENYFSFVHLSFLEYLCAYQIAEDKSKSHKEHIDGLLDYLENPVWEEIILLSLYLFEKSTGPSFIDSFSEVLFKKLSRKKFTRGWFLLGRAIRDNINFAVNDIKRIIKEIIKIWLKDTGNNIAFSILKEIAELSNVGKDILKEIIKENIRKNHAKKAFASLSIFQKFFEIDSTVTNFVSKNKDILNFLSYLPISMPLR